MEKITSVYICCGKKLQKGNTQQNNSTQFDMQDICKITRYFLEPLYDLNKNDMQFF